MELNVKTVFVIVVVCGLSDSIKVPVDWRTATEKTITQNFQSFQVPTNVQLGSPFQDIDYRSIQNEFRPIVTQTRKAPRMNTYFRYPNKKPNFYKKLESDSGLDPRKQSYRALPVKPKHHLRKKYHGQHYMNRPKAHVFDQFQEYSKKHSGLRHYLQPVHASYKVYHPYEEGKMEILNHKRDPQYKLTRKEIEANAQRFKQYVIQDEDVDIPKEENMKSPKETERDTFETNSEHENYPIEHEPHLAEKSPVYYNPPPKTVNHYNRLNNKLKYPVTNQDYIKVRPKSYDPLKYELGHVRAQQHQRFKDQEDDYPKPYPNYYQNEDNGAAPGVDIYDKEKFIFDKAQEEFDEFAEQPNPNERVVSQSDDDDEETDDDFVPVKMYAQVRKTDTIKHLPQEAAIQDAESYDEVINAPRLKQAVKSDKSQVVYSEEGYEDSAYDHAGHQKHASNKEAHNGSLKEKEASAGKYQGDIADEGYGIAGKTEEGAALTKGNKHENEDGKSNDHGDAESFNNAYGEYDEVIEPENYDEDNNEAGSDVALLKHSNNGTENNEAIENSDKETEKEIQVNGHTNQERKKRNADFKVPVITLENTYLTNDEIETVSRQEIPEIRKRAKSKKPVHKYPYYKSTSIKTISVHSPLRYAEDVAKIPRKSKGGTEFYDSTSNIDCPEVEDEIDAVPEHVKENIEENEREREEAKNRSKRKASYDEGSPRLSGLGDKIDCFKLKYFGQDPLDNPLFGEDTVGELEPVFKSLDPRKKNKKKKDKSKNTPSQYNDNRQTIRPALPKSANYLDNSYRYNKAKFIPKLKVHLPENLNQYAQNTDPQTRVYSDVINNIRTMITSKKDTNPIFPLFVSLNHQTPINKNDEYLTKKASDYKSYTNKEHIDNPSKHTRVVRDTRTNTADKIYNHIRRRTNDSTTTTEATLKNHKSEFTPITVRSSISMDDYLSKRYLNDTQANASNQSDSISAPYRRIRLPYRPITPIFDVTEYLPNIENYNQVGQRYNLSSTFKENQRRFNSRRKNVTTTEKPTTTTTSKSIEDDEATTNTPYESDEESDEDESEETQKDDSDDESEQEDEEETEKEETAPSTNEENVTVTPSPVDKEDKEEAINQWRKVLEQQEPSHRYASENNEEQTNKPRILEKTSKKRKTTVITNSKIFEDGQSADGNGQSRDERKPESRQFDDDDDDSDEQVVVITKRPAHRNYNTRKPLKQIKRYEQNVREEEIINENQPSSAEEPSDLENSEAITENSGPKQNLALEVNDLNKGDQHSLHSDVDIFRSGFEMNSGPKHGGNYRSLRRRTKKRRPSKEFEGEREASRRSSIHGGNYKTYDNLRDESGAHILSSLKSAIPEMDAQSEPKYIKDPSERMYYYVEAR